MLVPKLMTPYIHRGCNLCMAGLRNGFAIVGFAAVVLALIEGGKFLPYPGEARQAAAARRMSSSAL